MMCRLNVSTQQITANQHCYVINDLAEVDCFKDKPYVSGWPFARFYAEVPLKSGGFVIGSVCVGDNKPRSGMDVGALNKLTEVATAVAIHLDLVQAQNRLRRSQEMVRGLGQFVDGKVGPGNNHPFIQAAPGIFLDTMS
jgi:GAF domain-containing protein